MKPTNEELARFAGYSDGTAISKLRLTARGEGLKAKRAKIKLEALELYFLVTKYNIGNEVIEAVAEAKKALAKKRVNELLERVAFKK